MKPTDPALSHRVLRREHDAHAERSRLPQEGDEHTDPITA